MADSEPRSGEPLRGGRTDGVGVYVCQSDVPLTPCPPGERRPELPEPDAAPRATEHGEAEQ